MPEKKHISSRYKELKSLLDMIKVFGAKGKEIPLDDGAEAALLTCIGNDYGYPHVFEKPVKMFADSGDNPLFDLPLYPRSHD